MKKFFALFFFVMLMASCVNLSADMASANPKINFISYQCRVCGKMFESLPGDDLTAKDVSGKEQMRRVFQFSNRGKNFPECKNGMKFHALEKKGSISAGLDVLCNPFAETVGVIRDGGALSGISLTEWECVYCKKHYYSLNNENLNIRDWEQQTSYLYNLKRQAIPKCTVPGTWGHIFFPKTTGSVKSYELATIVYDLYWVKN